ncbi:hypothetical protein ABZZ80_00955 [Streptomyces sp. NPDC006356]
MEESSEPTQVHAKRTLRGHLPYLREPSGVHPAGIGQMRRRRHCCNRAAISQISAAIETRVLIIIVFRTLAVRKYPLRDRMTRPPAPGGGRGLVEGRCWSSRGPGQPL